MSVALESHTEVDTNKDAYDAEFDGETASDLAEGEEPDSSELCVDRETSCIYTY
jgi:hypothetical protein